MKELILSIGFAFGLVLAATTANATNAISCQKAHPNAAKKTCTAPDGTSVKVDADADATAVAGAIAAAQGGNATATGGSAVSGSTSNSGGNVISYNEAKQPRFTTGLGVTADVGDLMRVKTDNLAKIVETVDGASDKCFAAKVMNESPALFNWRTGKRLTIGC